MVKKIKEDKWTDDELDMLDSIGKNMIVFASSDRIDPSDEDMVEWSTDEKQDVFDCDDVVAYIED
jgi:hypothetical protein